MNAWEALVVIAFIFFAIYVFRILLAKDKANEQRLLKLNHEFIDAHEQALRVLIGNRDEREHLRLECRRWKARCLALMRENAQLEKQAVWNREHAMFSMIQHIADVSAAKGGE